MLAIAATQHPNPLMTAIVAAGYPTHCVGHRFSQPRDDFPVRTQTHVLLTAQLTNATRGARIVLLPHLPPALTAMVVLVVNDEAGVFHQRPDPADAVIAIVAVLHEAVADEEALRRAVVHI